MIRVLKAENVKVTPTAIEVRRGKGVLELAAAGGKLEREVIVGKNASLDFFERYAGGTLVQKTVFRLAEGAVLNYCSLQELPKDSGFTAEKEFHLAGRAELNAVLIDFGADKSKTYAKIILAGKGAKAKHRSAFLLSGRQKTELAIEVLHGARETESDVLARGALAGKASSIFSGEVRIGQKAGGSESRLRENILHLNEGVSSHSSPTMFIGNNEAKASHGATISKISEDEMFYLQARGIPAQKARELLLQGFLKEAAGSYSDKIKKMVV